MELSKERLHQVYLDMVTARIYEETLAEIYMEGKTPRFDIAAGTIPGEMHLAAGQEPCAAAVCIHLRDADTVTAPHRPHHVAIAKGVHLPEMTAEIFGKKTGLSGGRGGHMHLFDHRVNFACSGIVAQGCGPAVGAALASKMQGRDDVAVSYVGEGAANQGGFHESVNLAALWKLGVIFLIEDNAWAISVPKDASTSIERVADRAAAYGIPGVYVADNDTVTLLEVAGDAVARGRAGEGPTIIEVETFRFLGHFQGDAEVYRPADEVERLKERDPIPRFRAWLEAEGKATAEEADVLEEKARKRVEEAVEFARSSEFPEPEEALEKVFV
jgi:acetoin:2,6-dichlorophenolindophenol oxidoreductase subunit alpha